ncbi:methyltransferase family protein [Sphingomonas jaspsi]|uniref:methyltransferase family protein n=1 Tax=Sphingomonas jaspsi TaxID=392409 RepID=UPI00055A947A|nr:isoprenylcysteine carboxylmethyltransferase family protein [Sphingomonas jaspsi]
MMQLIAIYLLLAVWGASEIIVFRSDRQAGRGQRQDGYSRPLIFLAMNVAITLSMTATFMHWWRLPGEWWTWWLAGSTLVAAGIGFRSRAVRHLGRHFRTHVTIMDDHELIEDGPYRRVRHPSYTGMLVSCIGLGVAMGNMAAILLLTLLPMAGLANRIRVEERALAKAFGREWEIYRARTAALVPGLW